MTDQPTIADIVVTGIRDGNFAFQQNFERDAIFFSYHGVSYQIGADYRGALEGLGIVWDWLTQDTDGDGTADLLDNYRGFNDSTVVEIATTNSVTVARVADNVYAVFNSNGDKISTYLSMTGVGASTGHAEIGFNTAPNGIGFTFKGDDQVTFEFTSIPNPVGFP